MKRKLVHLQNRKEKKRILKKRQRLMDKARHSVNLWFKEVMQKYYDKYDVKEI